MLACRIGASGVLGSARGAIEPVLQDRLDRAVGLGADVVAARGRRLDALGP